MSDDGWRLLGEGETAAVLNNRFEGPRSDVWVCGGSTWVITKFRDAAGAEKFVTLASDGIGTAICQAFDHAIAWIRSPEKE